MGALRSCTALTLGETAKTLPSPTPWGKPPDSDPPPRTTNHYHMPTIPRAGALLDARVFFPMFIFLEKLFCLLGLQLGMQWDLCLFCF